MKGRSISTLIALTAITLTLPTNTDKILSQIVIPETLADEVQIVPPIQSLVSEKPYLDLEFEESLEKIFCTYIENNDLNLVIDITSCKKDYEKLESYGNVIQCEVSWDIDIKKYLLKMETCVDYGKVTLNRYPTDVFSWYYYRRNNTINNITETPYWGMKAKYNDRNNIIKYEIQSFNGKLNPMPLDQQEPEIRNFENQNHVQPIMVPDYSKINPVNQFDWTQGYNTVEINQNINNYTQGSYPDPINQIQGNINPIPQNSFEGNLISPNSQVNPITFPQN